MQPSIDKVNNMTGSMIQAVVSELKDGARQAIGSYSFYLPTLKEFGIDVEAKPVYEGEGDEKQLVGFEYEGNAHNYLGKAVEAAVRANARNKLLPKTATLRPGAKMPENFAEVITPSEGRGGSVVLAERQTLFGAWAAWVAKLERPESVRKLLVLFVKQPDALLTQPEKIKQTTEALITQFATEAAEAGKLTEYQAEYLNKVVENCAEASEAGW